MSSFDIMASIEVRPDDELQFVAIDCMWFDHVPEFARLQNPNLPVPVKERAAITRIASTKKVKENQKQDVTGYRKFLKERLDMMRRSKTKKRWSMNKRIAYVRDMWDNLSKAQRMKYAKPQDD